MANGSFFLTSHEEGTNTATMAPPYGTTTSTCTPCTMHYPTFIAEVMTASALVVCPLALALFFPLILTAKERGREKCLRRPQMYRYK